MKIGVINYQAGNLKSVETALLHLGADYHIGSQPEELKQSDKIIFPGVGEAKAAMDVLKAQRLDRFLIDAARAGKPILGICIGCQVIMDYSEESDTRCLGIIEGTVKRFPDNSGLKVPHMGWNQVSRTDDHWLFKGIPNGASFYFVHSYYPYPSERETILSITDYGFGFASSICKDNVAAVQFHPEKSGRYGLRLLRNFLEAEK